ncbi:hypothetical protein CEXT_318041 [Caerostris extrusa]|uniref:Uncharacterized protein n=1 Tax=Caerostris extrusa TaxID=172846 RepID=A0AAV4RX25_CAEEX|nr:hypothetical protein CEXT_318041 [Caerostris extrusa]
MLVKTHTFQQLFGRVLLGVTIDIRWKGFFFPLSKHRFLMCPLASLLLVVWTTLSSLMVRAPPGAAYYTRRESEEFSIASAKPDISPVFFDDKSETFPHPEKQQQFHTTTTSQFLKPDII